MMKKKSFLWNNFRLNQILVKFSFIIIRQSMPSLKWAKFKKSNQNLIQTIKSTKLNNFYFLEF